MKALILASGAGRRLRPLTEHAPKTLTQVGNKTILDYQLDALTKHGIDKVIITTGPFREKIIEHVQSNYSIKASFVNNPRYETTNYIYTLWLTKDLIDEDIVLMHGDLMFDSMLMEKLLTAKGNRVPVNRKIRPPKKDFKALIENDRVVKIALELSGPNTYLCAPMYKFSNTNFLQWIAEIESFVKKGQTNCYAEDAFNEISKETVLYPLYSEEFCMEIDTLSDLRKVEGWLRSKAKK